MGNDLGTSKSYGSTIRTPAYNIVWTDVPVEGNGPDLTLELCALTAHRSVGGYLAG